MVSDHKLRLVSNNFDKLGMRRKIIEDVGKCLTKGAILIMGMFINCVITRTILEVSTEAKFKTLIHSVRIWGSARVASPLAFSSIHAKKSFGRFESSEDVASSATR